MENFGIKLDQIIFQIINFFIILVILKKFLYKPIVSFILKQKTQQDEYYKITQEINNQNEYLKKLSEDKKEELKKLYEETMDKTNKEAHQVVETAKDTAKAEGKRILSEYNNEAVQTKDSMLKSAQDEIYQRAVNIAESLIKSSLTDIQKQKLMELAVENLKNE